MLFHSEFGELSLPQFETMAAVLPQSEMWSVNSPEQAQRTPNGAGHRASSFVEGTLGTGLADFGAATEASYRRVSYLTQLAQSEAMRAVVDGGRLGVAGVNGSSGVWERPWGYMFWQLNDVTQAYSWGSLEYGGRLKLMHYRSQQWFAPVRVECNTVTVAEQASDLAPTASNCSFEPNVDFATSDMHKVSASSKEGCCAKCSAIVDCAAGVFVAKDNACWIKTDADMKHKVPGRPGIPTVACVTHGPKLPPSPPPTSSLICTAANDGPIAWSGVVTLAIAPLTQHCDHGAKQWNQTVTVGPVPPGQARRFWVSDPAVAKACETQGHGPCWLFGQTRTNDAITTVGAMAAASQPAPRADIGVPFQPLKSLVTNKLLPSANVTATVSGTNSTSAELAISASSAAAALYVHLTSASQGQFSEASQSNHHVGF